jgi:high affinity sulfate transporter 1
MNNQAAGGWRAVFPPASWLPAYRASFFPADVVAGVTLAAYAVPVSLAYATLAGLPPQVGVYGYLLGGLGYALFGSSRQLAIGPTSAISLMVGTSVAAMAGGDPTRFGQIATLAAMVTAVLFVFSWLLRLSALTAFISETILLGFKAGAALSIASTQLPALLGIAGGGDHFFERLYLVGAQLGTVKPAVMAVGFGALALLWLGERHLPGRPVALGVVALSIVAAHLLGLGAMGVPTVGVIPPGLPSIGLPELRAVDVPAVVPLAAACLLLAYIESVSAARTFAEKHGYEVDVRQELLGLGAANLGAALGNGYAVAGGLSQSAVNDKAGARTPLALVFASGALALCLLFLTGLLRDLPKAVLAAIVLMAVKDLIKVREIARLRRVSRMEFRVAMVALAGVLLLGILQGVLLAAVASLALLLARASRPHVAVLGRIPGTRRYSDMERHPDNEPVVGAVLLRVEASLMYFNADNVLRETLAKAREAPPGTELAVLDLSTSPYVDMAGARMLMRLQEALAKEGMQLLLAETRAEVRDMLRAEGVPEKVGSVNRHISVDDVVHELASEPVAASGRPRED